MRAVRIVSGLKGVMYEKRLKEQGLITVEERRHRMNMIQSYKIATGKE
jgi:hypothetical protein